MCGRFFRAFLVGIVCVGGLAPEETAIAADSPRRIEFLQDDEMDWAEGRRTVEQELKASGYIVEHRKRDAVDLDVLLDELAGDSSTELTARITVLRLGRTGIAYVWLVEPGSTYRVTSGEPDPVRAANVLSLRVVELIELRTEGGFAEPTEEGSSSPPPASPPPALPRSAPAPALAQRAPERLAHGEKWLVFAGGGMTLGNGVVAPLGSVELALDYRAFRLLGVGATVSVGLNRSARSLDQGVVRAGRQRGAVGLFVGSRRSPWWQWGLNVGLECYQLSWQGGSAGQAGDDSVCAPSSASFARAGFRWKDTALWSSASVSMMHRPLRLLAFGESVAQYGQPEVTLSGGVGWFF